MSDEQAPISPDSRPEDGPAADSDREAILRRRQRFIATALGGLAASLTGCPQPAPRPCLKVMASPPQKTGQADGQETKTSPQPCLRMAVDPDAGKTDGPKTDGPKTDGPKTDEGAQTPEGEKTVEPETKTLRAAPQPCLKVRRRDPEDEPPGPEPR
ncbi:MAG: hypothetical protein AB7N76_11310 [Planctomycetota bacterium]